MDQVVPILGAAPGLIGWLLWTHYMRKSARAEMHEISSIGDGTRWLSGDWVTRWTTLGAVWGAGSIMGGFLIMALAGLMAPADMESTRDLAIVVVIAAAFFGLAGGLIARRSIRTGEEYLHQEGEAPQANPRPGP